jgi:hypothetical protein
MSNVILFWAAVIGIVGVVGSLLFAGWQTRELVRQTRIQNAIAGTSGARQAIALLDETARILVDRPEMRPYFHAGLPCPTEEPERSRVQAVAELYLDALGCALHTTRLIESSDSYGAWKDCTQFYLRQSPTLRDIVREHPTWWPNVVGVIEPVLESSTPDARRDVTSEP